jgi:protein gp37
MSDKTGIQWTDATWNPIRGCSRVSEGCRNCYAEVVAARFSKPGQPYEGLARRTANGGARWTGKIMFVEKHLEDPLRWRKPKRIFVNSMSDLFHEGVSEEQLDMIFAVMAIASRHTFQILTKRPERMRDYLNTPGRAGATAAETGRGAAGNRDWPFIRPDDLAARWPLKNVWLGVSVEDQKAANLRVPLLLDTPATVRFLSCEPLLAPVDLVPFLYDEVEGTTMPDFSSPRASNRGLSWVIIGGESGSYARSCDVQWIRDIVDQCKAAGIASFVKQLGSEPGIHAGEDEYAAGFSFHHYDPVNQLNIKKLEDSHGGNPEEWPADLRVREFPGVTA